MSTPRRPLRSTVPLACVVALALWFASTLGLMHGATHAPGLAQTTTQAQRPDPAGAIRATGAVAHAKAGLPGAVAALFTGHDAGDAQCRLYDQLSHGPAAIAVPPVVLPLVLPTARFDFFQGEAVARWVALFQARGPPSSR